MLTLLKLVLSLNAPHQLVCGDITYPCAIGQSGVIVDKKEGDGGTPSGSFKLKNLYYRKDKVGDPETSLPKIEITPDLGWCDEPESLFYNCPVTLPFDFSHEEMWRKDDVYDLVIEIDHNSDPIMPGMGSAVFIHVAREGFKSTAGCIALHKDDLLALLKQVSPETILQTSQG